MPVFATRALGVLLLLCAASAWAAAYSGYAFRISDIQVQGLQRLSKGTVLTYLPVASGDRMTPARAARSVKALYKTGLFDNVALDRRGDTLVVNVAERPEIASFKLTGNKALSSDRLKKALDRQGLSQGELFKRSLLDNLRQQLMGNYYSNGYYSVQVNTDVEQLPNNRVAIDVAIDEGPIAAIKQINIVGNDRFSDDRLRQVFSLEEKKSLLGRIGAHPLTFWKSHDRYSRQKLVGDLEALNSFYKDRGYLRFNVSSVQVSIAPDKKDVFVTVNVDEGRQYSVSDVKLAGRLIEPKATLARLLEISAGETYSRQKVQDSANQISSGLADFGYAFADVDPLTKIDDDAHTVALTFYVKPGARAYVREIGFSGNQKTTDQTLRREMRQFEGAPYSRRAVQRSRVRLQRLPFVQSVKVNKDKVAGQSDRLDLDYAIEERPAGKLQLGFGYSGQEGFLINGSVSNSNFRGTGNTISFQAQTNSFTRSVRASYTDPYFTREGVSRTISAFYRNSDSLVRTGSSFDLDSYGATMLFRFPISEYSNIRAGAGVEQNNIQTGGSSSSRVKRFVRENGSNAFTYSLKTGWQRDTRNRTIFATKGSDTEVNFDVKGPGSDLEYYSASVEHQRFFRVGSWVPGLSKKFVLGLDGRVAQTDIWGEGTDVPPYDNYFAGGPKSLRGFASGGAGPQNEFGDPYGGQFLTTLQTNLVIPTFLKSDNKSTRLSLFYDVGAAYEDIHAFDAGELRRSAGVAFDWFTPFFGLLRVSYAPYVHDERGDDIKRFQFSFGVGL